MSWNTRYYIKKNKYSNNKKEYNGKAFDSLKELRRFKELELLEQVGEINNLKTQVKYELIPAQKEPDTKGPKGGLRKGRVIERPVTYIADFVYEDKDGNTVVEDVKSPITRTPQYIIKRKLMLYIHGIRITEI